MLKPSFIAMALLACSNLTLACSKPDVPTLPDPATAVTPQMIKAKNDVKAFLDAAETYLECAPNTNRYNDMVDDMHKVAEDFNGIVRDYKSRMSG